MKQSKPITLEWRLLLACARVPLNEAGAAAIRQIPFEHLDWTLFARLAVAHGLAGLAGQTLDSVVSERVPEDILHAFRANRDETRRRSRALLVKLARVIDALANTGVDAIPLRGPVLALQGYDDLGCRMFSGLDLLIRDSDRKAAISALHRLGYERRPRLTAAQLNLMGRLQSRETFNQSQEMDLTIHTQLAPLTAPLDIDYAALWRRIQRTALNIGTVGTLAPEDNLLVLAILGGQELWRQIGSACDVAAFIGSHPNLDWAAIRERAGAQGCLRMVLLTTAVASRYFGAAVPDVIAAVARGDRLVGPMAQRVMARWHAEEAVGIDHGIDFSMDRTRLHDRIGQRLGYLGRSALFPAAHHVARMRLPERFTTLITYVPVKLGQDFALRPMVRGYRALRAQSQRLRDALGSSRFALPFLPVSAETRLRLRRHHESRAEATRTLAANPNDAAAWHRLGNALAGLKRYEQAIACYDKALTIAPEIGRFWNDRVAVARASKAQTTDTEDELTLDPHDARAWTRRAGFFAASQRFREAAAASDRALAIDPSNLTATRIGIRSRISACDWHKRDDDKRRVTEGLKAGLPIITPFNHRAISESEAEHLVVTRMFARNFPRPKPLWSGEVYRHERIRVAYLCANFNTHPTAILIAGVLEHHEKKRFETIACSFGPGDGSSIRRRIEGAMDHFVDAHAMSDADVASKLRAMEVDIAIDLNGHAGGGRPQILAHRPCPAQVSYVGNAGTMGVPFLDYMIADRTVVPNDCFAHYTEKIVYLPHSYQCNDSRRFVPQRAPSRAEAGLPDAGFVYCCFNSAYKIAPAVFDIWMRLLSACPGSVLWLLNDNPDAGYNLRREAAARGVGAERLVFAPRMPEEDHLARLMVADLFLDTLPVNAHATAADALWAGVPVVTCLGNTFAGRVGASVLRAVALPELVTSSLLEYEQLSLSLARDRARLAALKSKLVRNRYTEPLFDTARYTRDLEAAYTIMVERSRRGAPPENFSVESVRVASEPLNA